MRRIPPFTHRFATTLGLLLAGLALIGCTAAPVGQSLFDESTDFSTYRSFAFLSEDVLVVSSASPVNPALESILVEEVQAYLTKRGYRFVADPGSADFTIGFAVGGNPSTRTTAFGDNYNQVRIIGAGVDDEVVNQDSTRAGLMIDFFDRTGTKKWMGYATDEITMGDQMRLRSTVRDIVAIILKNFPPEA